MTNPKTVILANGAMPSHPVPLALFAAAVRVVCCDGAYAKALALGRGPDLVVGDGDSLDDVQKGALGVRFVNISEQETNDLAKAFRMAVERFGADGIVILGADGLREDHFLGNMFRLPDFARVSPDVSLVTNAGEFTVVVDERVYESAAGDSVSVFAPSYGTQVTSVGLEWPLDGVPLDSLWRATLNRAAGTSFAISTNRPVIVYRPH
jgi:thiamine pyrophosphokinase